MPKSPQEMKDAIVRNLKEKTGRTLEEWRAHVEKKGPKDIKEARAWLKATYGIGTIQAAVVVGDIGDYSNPEQLVNDQYSGPREPLRPIYEAVLSALKKLGKDVRPVPCKTYVPFRAVRMFALAKVGPKRVDLAFALPGHKATARLEPAPGFSQDRITHKVALRSPAEVDAEVLAWLRAAYDASFV